MTLKIVHYFKSCYEVSTSKRVEYVEGSLESILLRFGAPLWEAKSRTALFHWFSLLPVGTYFLIDRIFQTSYWMVVLVFVLCRLFYTMQFRYVLTESHILRINKLFKSIDAIGLLSLLPLNEYSSFAVHSGILNYKKGVVAKKSKWAPKEKVVGICSFIWHMLPFYYDVCVFRMITSHDITSHNNPFSEKYFYNLSRKDYKTYKMCLGGIVRRCLSKTMTETQIKRWLKREERDRKIIFISHLIVAALVIIIFLIALTRFMDAFSSINISST